MFSKFLFLTPHVFTSILDQDTQDLQDGQDFNKEKEVDWKSGQSGFSWLWRSSGWISKSIINYRI